MHSTYYIGIFESYTMFRDLRYFSKMAQKMPTTYETLDDQKVKQMKMGTYRQRFPQYFLEDYIQ